MLESDFNWIDEVDASDSEPDCGLHESSDEDASYPGSECDDDECDPPRLTESVEGSPLTTDDARWDLTRLDEAEIVENQNLQVLQLIAVLGEKDAGRRAILKALAGKQGFSYEIDVERLLDGSSRRKLQVPAYMRGTLADIGLAPALAPLNIFDCCRRGAIADGGGLLAGSRV